MEVQDILYYTEQSKYIIVVYFIRNNYLGLYIIKNQFQIYAYHQFDYKCILCYTVYKYNIQYVSKADK